MNEQQKNTLMKWRSRYKRAQLAHSYTAISFERYHYSLGVILIILTTASCVFIFSSSLFPSWLSPTISIAAALFAYLQTFLQLSERTDTHRKVARRYGSLKKEVEYIIDFQSEEKNLSELVESIRNEEVEIANDSLHALTHRWRKAKNETQQENEKTSIRNRK